MRERLRKDLMLRCGQILSGGDQEYRLARRVVPVPSSRSHAPAAEVTATANPEGTAQSPT
jgi:hypothetical protein